MESLIVLAFLSNNLGNLVYMDIFRSLFCWLQLHSFNAEQKIPEDTVENRKFSKTAWVLKKKEKEKSKSTCDFEGSKVDLRNIYSSGDCPWSWVVSMKNEWWRVKLPSCQYLICFKTTNKQTNKQTKNKNQPPLTFPVAQMVKSLPAIQETWVWSLGREDSPGEGNGNLLQYSCLEKSHGQSSMVGYIQSMGLQRVRHDWVTFLSFLFLSPDLCLTWPD